MGAAKMALRGVEPELFNPEDLLAATAGDSGASSPAAASSAAAQQRPGLASIPGDPVGSKANNWFANWFGKGGAGGDDSVSDPGGEGVLRRPPPTLRVPKAVSDQEGVQVEVTRLLVASYFDIVRKNLQDAVPKALMHFMVNAVQRGLQQHLIRKLYREELFEAIMEERQDIAAKRAACQEALRALRSAQSTLEGLPAELLGRVNQSGRWSFKQVLEAASPDRSSDHLTRGGSGANGRAAAAARAAVPVLGAGAMQQVQAQQAQQQLSAAQKAAMSAVTLLSGGGIAAHRVSPR